MDEGRLVLKNWILENYNAKEMMANSVKTDDKFEISELLHIYQKPEDIILILETLNKTHTTKWMEKYAQQVIKLIKSENSPEQQNRIYYEKWDNLSSTQQKKNSELTSLRESIDAKLLENLPKAKNSSNDLEKILSDLEPLTKPNVKIQNPVEIQNIQTRGMFLAHRISKSANNLGIFDVILEALEKTKENFLLFEVNELTQKLLKQIQSKKSAKFPSQINLSWLNKSNYRTVIDSYLQKSFRESINVNYRQNDPSAVWKEEVTGKVKRKRGKSLQTESGARRDEFKVWFETFYQYAFATKFPANVEENLKKLFAWTDFGSFDLQDEGKSCFSTIIQNRTTPPQIYDCERRFIEVYLNADYTEIRPTDWDLLNKLNDVGLSRLVKKIRWERDNARFMIQFSDSDVNVSEQEKLAEYIKLLKNNTFDDEAKVAEKRVILTEDESSRALAELWEKNDVESYFYTRRQYAAKGMPLPSLPEMDIEVFNDNEDWFKEHGLGYCSMEDSHRHAMTRVERKLLDLLYSNGFGKWFQTFFDIAPHLTQDGYENDYDESEIILEALAEHFTPEPSAKNRRKFRSIDDSYAKFIAFLQIKKICQSPAKSSNLDATTPEKIQEVEEMYTRDEVFFNPKSLEEVTSRIDKFRKN